MSSLQSDYGFARLTAIGSGKGGTGKTFVSLTLCPVSYTHLDVYKRQPKSR